MAKNRLNFGQKICAIVKADAYGFGAKKTCKLLNDKVDYFAVSSPSEFFEIQKISTKPILILDPVIDKKILSKLIKFGVELTISNFESLQAVIDVSENFDGKVKIHLAYNTGMNRFGFKTKTAVKSAIDKIEKTQNIEICGVFSHYFYANNEKFANIQYNSFFDLQQYLKSFLCPKTIFHIANSDGLLYKNGFDMVRVGMGLYTDKVYSTIKLKSKIIDIQIAKKGEIAGYNAIFKATRKSKLAVVAIGYGDGIFRSIAGKGYVLINGEFAKIVAVCMDSILVDITGINAKINDDVILIGKSGSKQIFICDLAKWCDTIDYEIIVRLSSRVRRKYIEENYASHNRKIQSKETC